MSKDKKPDLYDLMNDDSLWGNQATDTLSHEQLISTHATIIANNRARANSDEWKKVVAKRKVPTLSKEQRKEASARTKKLWQDPDYAQSVKKGQEENFDEWLENIRRANTNPERNKKISEAHSVRLQTPAGIFANAKKASEYYNMSLEGIRYRIKVKEDWFYLDPQPPKPKARSKKQNEADRIKRLTAVAEKNGYIYTPYGKFLSVREAWREEQKHNKIPANPHLWFKNANRDMPEKYYKK